MEGPIKGYVCSNLPSYSGCDIFQRVEIIGKSERTAETTKSCKSLLEMSALRKKYIYQNDKSYPKYPLSDISSTKIDKKRFPKKQSFTLSLEDGVFCIKDEKKRFSSFIKAEEFFSDLENLMRIEAHGATKSLAYNRLKILKSRFKIHVLYNENLEVKEVKKVPHSDFYNMIKVDNHVHHSACMNSKQFLSFVKNKMRTEKEFKVANDENGDPLTFKDVMKSIDVSEYNISIDRLDTHAHKETFHRFDKFNQKYNPVGSSLLRTIFLKTSNEMDGRYLAEITKEVFEDLKAKKYIFTEYRLSIYGKSYDDWEGLSTWIVDNELYSPNNLWMIQIPRLYEIYKSNNLLKSFEEMIVNIFKPMFQATLDPESHPKIFKFLQLITGFDTVDDESVNEKYVHNIKPADWTQKQNPSYSMYCYYIYANLYTLNQLRESIGLNTFSFRPHSGEAGPINHLGTAFLLANSISHGILLDKSPVLCYLYYLEQIGISVAPLSNNVLFLKKVHNPFPKFFKIGLNVTLSTDDPLMIHYTKDPLIEEYSVAAQTWGLSKTDISEIAVNSVYQSGFDKRIKKLWIGENHKRMHIYSKVCEMTNIPTIRIILRRQLYDEEKAFIQGTLSRRKTH